MKVYLVVDHEMIACVDCGTPRVHGIFLTREEAQCLVDKEGMDYGGRWTRYVIEEWTPGADFSAVSEEER